METGFDIIKQAMYSTKLSRMLAQENIAVVFEAAAKTASFAPESRTLTFPHSTAFMDTDIHELFMFHEISHAIHLPPDSMEIVKRSGVDFDLFNIVIDIRDERLIKARYPGAVKTFTVAYAKLVEQGFFGDMEKLNHRSFANRLNVYAKVGVRLGASIPMSAQEHQFYDRCMKAEKLEECIELARELSKLDKNSDTLDELFDSIMEKIVTDDEEDELSEKERQAKVNEELEKLREERVQDMFSENFSSSILSNAHVVSYESTTLKDIAMVKASEYTNIIKKRLLDDTDQDDSLTDVTESVRDVRRGIQQSVDSMVRVFESKKAAQRYRNAKVSDTGMVDLNKVYRYKFDDKIFKKSIKIPNSKNHAYYIMIDMSGSMHSIFRHVVEQIIVLTEFLRRIQVPYKVIGFGAVLRDAEIRKKFEEEYHTYQTPMPGVIKGRALLLELMSHEQSTADHNLAITGLLSSIGFGLGSTPTGYAMVAAEQHANAFFMQTNVDKKHMVVITDGEPSDLRTVGYGVYGKTLMIVDPVMKKVVTSKSSSPYATINAFGKIFEYRYGIEFTTISLMSSLKESRTSAFVSTEITQSMKDDWKQRGYTNVQDPFTKNSMFFAKPFGIETDIGELADDISEKSTTQIARSMLKNMKSVKKSRNFLNALAEKLS